LAEAGAFVPAFVVAARQPEPRFPNPEADVRVVGSQDVFAVAGAAHPAVDNRARRGQRPVAPSCGRSCSIAGLLEPPNERQASLTGRERDVCDLIGRGMTTDEVASELVISPLTVDTHVRNVMRKLALGRREIEFADSPR
jgi:DNA-binding CsgD family transcriptional regulator